MYCSPFSLIACFTKFICVCYRINLAGGQWKKAVKRKSINQWSRVAAGITVLFCTWVIVCWTCLGLTIKKLAVLLRSVSGGFRWWLQKPLCYWALMILKPCCHRVFSGIPYEKGHTYFTVAWRKYFMTKWELTFQFWRLLTFKSDVKIIKCLGMTYLTSHPKAWLSFRFLIFRKSYVILL